MRLASPDISSDRPSRSRPILSSAASRLLEAAVRHLQGEQQPPLRLAISTPSAACRDVRVARRLKRRARCRLPARDPRLTAPACRPVSGRPWSACFASPPPSLQVLKRGNHFGITIAELLGSSASPEGVASAADRVTRSAARVQCLASASTSMRSSHGCCARHASMLAALLGAFDACVRRRWRWCAAHQGWRPLWRSRSREERLHVGRSALRPGPEPTRTGGVRNIFGDKTPYYGVYPSSMVLGAIWCRNPHEKRLRWARELYSTVKSGVIAKCVALLSVLIHDKV